MNVDITNHLIPWTQVKVMIREAKREAWSEGFAEGVEYVDDNNDWACEFGPLPTSPGNPYREDA